jgi:5,10-methylenetetrahydromethanopterin reductase
MDRGILVPGNLGPDQLLEFANCAEELGYTDFFHADERFFRDVYTVLGPVAKATSKLRVGPLTTDPFSRHPALTAMAIGTLAEMSGGRAMLGIGPGSSGFQTLGIDRSRVVTRLREAIELVRLLLCSQTNVTYKGETVSFVNDRLGFGPLPYVPVVIGTRGPNLLALAGELADQVVIGGYCSRATVEWALDHVDQGLERVRRDREEVKISVMVYASIDDDRRKALDAARWGTLVALWSSLSLIGDLPLGVEVPEELLNYMGTTQKSFHPEIMAPGMRLIPDELLVPLSFAGTPDDCRQRLGDIAQSGGGRVDEIILLPCPVPGQPPLDVITRFAKEVFSE